MTILGKEVPAVARLDHLIDALREYHFNYSEGLVGKTARNLERDVNGYRQWFREIQEYVRTNPPNVLTDGRAIMAKKEIVFSLLGAFTFVQ